MRLGPRFLRAFLFAAEKHAGQARKASTIPYIAHLMGVASLVLEAGGDEDLAIAALLHDVVEDCGGAPMLKEVRRRFGKRAANIVEGCTDTDIDPKPPWRARKENYLRHLRDADQDTRLVSAADKLHNVRSTLTDYREAGNLSGQGSMVAATALFGTIGFCWTNFSSARRTGSRESWNLR